MKIYLPDYGGGKRKKVPIRKNPNECKHASGASTCTN